MNIGSLFSGIGGFDLGFEREGFSVSWQCEIDKFAQGILNRHWPGTTCYVDIRNLDGAELAPIDVLAGGFPCQDISAGKDRWGAKGLEGEKSGLWWQFARIIDEAQPRWVLIENVGRLRNGREGSDFRRLVGELTRLGYLGVAGILDAAAFDLPARRPRVFLVARNSRDISGVSEWRRMVEGWVGNDPGCVVLQGRGQPCWQDDGAARPTRSNYRMLTPLECERVMGFPEGWTVPGGSNTQRYKQLGNSVAVPVVQWLAQRIREASGEH